MRVSALHLIQATGILASPHYPVSAAAMLKARDVDIIQRARYKFLMHVSKGLPLQVDSQPRLSLTDLIRACPNELWMLILGIVP